MLEVDDGHAPATRVGQIGAVPIEKEIVHAMPTLPDQLRQLHRGGGIRDIDDDEAEVAAPSGARAYEISKVEYR